MLFPLLRLVERDLLLQGTVLHLLVLEQQRLNLALQLLENHFVVLYHDLQVLVLLLEVLHLALVRDRHLERVWIEALLK